MARKVHREIDDAFLARLEKQSKNNQSHSDAKNLSVLDLFKTRHVRQVTFNLSFAFFANYMLYYGLSYSVDLIPGNLYFNNAINGGVEIFGYFLCLFGLDRFGRRRLTAWLVIFCASACLLASACHFFQTLLFASKARDF